MFENIPNVKLGLIAVSRDCFPRTLSEMRRANIAKACEGGVYECPVIVENEADMLRAVADVKAADCNALVVFLGNFGPETPKRSSPSILTARACSSQPPRATAISSTAAATPTAAC